MIRLTRNRLTLTAVVLLLATIPPLLWEICEWPPPRLILKYGFPPAGGPTGKEIELQGNRFMEMRPGYRHLLRPFYTVKSTWLHQLCRTVGLPAGPCAARHPLFEDRWIEVRDSYWISTRYLWAYRRDGDTIALPRPIMGSLRPPTSEELWFAAITGALDLSPFGTMALIDDQGTAPPYRSRVMYLGQAWSAFNDNPDSAHGEIAPWPACPVVWVPPPTIPSE